MRKDLLILIFRVSIVYWYIYIQSYIPVYGIAAMLLSFTVLPYVYKIIKHVVSWNKSKF